MGVLKNYTRKKQEDKPKEKPKPRFERKESPKADFDFGRDRFVCVVKTLHGFEDILIKEISALGAENVTPK